MWLFVQVGLGLGLAAGADPQEADRPALDDDDDRPVTLGELKDLLGVDGDGSVRSMTDAPPPGTGAADESSWPSIDVGGGIFLWHYHPLFGGTDPSTEIYWAYLTFDVDLPGEIDFHMEPFFRNTPLRPFFSSSVWLQQAYLSWKPKGGEYGELKAGKAYSLFGRFWDGTFYGNVPYFDGLKLDPDIGLSYEHTIPWGDSVTVATSLQFFTRDGRTNGSLQGRDTLSYAGAVQRDTFVARVAPTFDLGEDTALTVGASGMSFDPDFPGQVDDQVDRWNVEASLDVSEFTVFGEGSWQDGSHVPDHPFVGAKESDIFWLMSGVSYDVTERLELGYRFSFAEYQDSNVREMFHMPRAQYQLTESVSVWLEYVNWDQESREVDTRVDDSLNLVLYAYF